MKGMLDRDWGITDREGLLRQIYSLLRAGHREDFGLGAICCAECPAGRD